MNYAAIESQMMKSIKYILISAVVLGSMTGVLRAVPKPKVNSQSWQLKFDYHDLQRIKVVLPGDSTPTTFWYLLYTVTNESGREIDFYPSFELVTESLEVITGGENISPTVYDAIKARYKKTYPFLCDATQVSGKLLQGTDNCRTSAVVFRDFSAEANSLTVYVAGLSGEVVQVSNPKFDSKKVAGNDNKPFFALRKTLAISYDVPGDSKTREEAVAIRQSQEWVMR